MRTRVFIVTVGCDPDVSKVVYVASSRDKAEAFEHVDYPASDYDYRIEEWGIDEDSR